jgi:sialidase-1
MTRILCEKSGLVYKNDIPHVYSRHAAHPSIAVLNDREILSSAVIGQAFESADTRAYLFRSADAGETWTTEGLLFGDTGSAESDLGRLSTAPNGDVVAVYFKHDRSRKDQGYTNPDNMGFTGTTIFLTKSSDGGKTWATPWRIDPPLAGPAFESQSAVLFLRDGRWLLPTSTWRGWDGSCPDGMKAAAFVSYDEGVTWPDFIDIMDDYKDGIIYFESSLSQLPDNRLLCTAWGYNEKDGSDLMNQYVISNDGKTFGKRMSTGLYGQTMATIPLADGRLFSVYRRMDKKGFWANLARLDGQTWINETELPLWGTTEEGLVHTGGNMSANFARLKFGAPRIALIGNTIFVAFWCYEDFQGVIRWFKIHLQE